MSDDGLNIEQAKALAAYLVTLRDDWDLPGVTTVLWNARGRAPARDFTCAAVGAATAVDDEGNPIARTPAVIDQPGQHWRHRTADVRPDFDRPDDNRRCSICYLAYDDCRARWRQDHDFLSIVDQREQAVPAPASIRAAIHGTTDSQEPTDG